MTSARVLLTAAVVACACQPSPAQIRAPFAGCGEVDRDRVCILKADGTTDLRVWLGEARRIDGVWLDDVRLPFSVTSTAGGRLVRSRFDAEGELRIATPGGQVRIPVRATSRARAQDVETSSAARRVLAAGDATGAVARLERAARRHATAGAWSRAIRDVQAASYAYAYLLQDPESGRRVLAEAEPWLGDVPDARAIHPYYEGLVAMAEDRLPRALEAYRRAVDRLTPLDDGDLISTVEEQTAFVLTRMGQPAAARAVRKRVAGRPSKQACDEARHLNNYAWGELLALDRADRPPPREVMTVLARAGALYERPECRVQPGRETLLLNRALAELLSRRPRAARRWLDETEPRPRRLDARLWRAEIAARIDATEGRLPRATRALEDAARLAESTLLSDVAWRLHVRRGRLLARGKLARPAEVAYRAAEASLDDSMLKLPLGEGRGSYLADRASSAREWAELLLSRSAFRKAACVLRRAAARETNRSAAGLRIRALDPAAREAWSAASRRVAERLRTLEAEAAAEWDLPVGEREASLARRAQQVAEARTELRRVLERVEAARPPPSCGELRAPREGELLLSWYPTERGWLGVAATPSRVRVHRFVATSDEGADWLAPFDAEIAAAERVFVSRVAPVNAIHTASWRGRPLVASRPVAYRLDLPAAPRPPARRKALVVADPERNLRGARAEGAVVRAHLARHRWATRRIDGATATPRAVSEALGDVDLFHYAGHASARPDAWGDYLALSQGVLRAQDIIVQPAVPRWVLLSGCRTGTPEHDGVNLAQAFVLAGAEEVLALAEDLPDELGGQIGAALYAGLSDGAPDLARWLHLTARRDDPPPTWRAFRVWVP